MALVKTTSVFAEVLQKETGDDVYTNMQNSSAESAFYDLTSSAQGGSVDWTMRLYTFHSGLSSIGPFAMIFSFAAGCLIIILARKNKGLRRFALFGLCIGVPAICIIFIYGLGALLGIFVH